MPEFDYDLFTIGAGSGGVRASRMSARYGARVAIAESVRLGGTCVNVGCIPKKLYAYAAHVEADLADAAGFGWTIGDTHFDWATLRRNKDAEITRLNEIYATVLAEAGVTILRGRATLLDAHTVLVNGLKISARHILIATGGWPQKPSLPGADLAITSNEFFALDEQPKRVLVFGGGYVAVELASIFNGLGSATTLVNRGAQLLKDFDADLGAMLAVEMVKKGLSLRLRTTLEGIERHGSALRVTLGSGEQLEVDCVLFATGRRPHTAGLGLEALGVELNPSGAIKVDRNFQSSVASIHAIGDATDTLALTPVALAEGMVLADHLFNSGQRQIGYENVPTAIFSNPNIATVGLSEASARERYPRVSIYRSNFRALKHTLSGNAERILLKLVVDAASDRVVGVHMVGPDAGEIVQGFAVALNCGATKAQFDATLGIHPTVAEEFVTMREPV
jgi:glutathione reductase (NADPH)